MIYIITHKTKYSVTIAQVYEDKRWAMKMLGVFKSQAMKGSVYQLHEKLVNDYNPREEL